MSAFRQPPGEGDPQDRFLEAAGGLRLCYRTYGNAGDPPALLIAGLGLQLTSWPASFIDTLVDAGYYVIAPDNRDAGRSSTVRQAPPGKLRQLLGRAPAGSYGLEDMADDMALLLDHLQADDAHLIGMSMGGMIAQCMAARYPARARSLTSIFSTTGARRVGRPALSTLLRMARAAPRDEGEAVAGFAAMMRHIGDPGVTGIATEWERYALEAWRRNGNRANAGGIGRQIGAILKSGDRSPQLRRITASTLVLHGEVDLMVAPSGGRATAAAIPGARLVSLPRLRHQIDEARVPELMGHIVPHLALSARVRSA